MAVDYNNISEKFSKGREFMKWPEIDYFLSLIGKQGYKSVKILDIGCGNGRLLTELKQQDIVSTPDQYLGIDLSENLLEKAKSLHPGYHFSHLDMKEIHNIKQTFDIIFFIASFHHLESEGERKNVLKHTSALLNNSGYIYMSNWALSSDFNNKKYHSSRVADSENTFGNADYQIKFGEYYRYYHDFDTTEIACLAELNQLSISANRIFEGDRNIISILQK